MARYTYNYYSTKKSAEKVAARLPKSTKPRVVKVGRVHHVVYKVTKL